MSRSAGEEARSFLRSSAALFFARSRPSPSFGAGYFSSTCLAGMHQVWIVRGAGFARGTAACRSNFRPSTLSQSSGSTGTARCLPAACATSTLGMRNCQRLSACASSETRRSGVSPGQLKKSRRQSCAFRVTAAADLLCQCANSILVTGSANQRRGWEKRPSLLGSSGWISSHTRSSTRTGFRIGASNQLSHQAGSRSAP